MRNERDLAVVAAKRHGVFTLADARSRGGLASDLALLWRTSPRRLCTCITGMVAFLGLLLWPLLHTPNLIFYDGSANHDSFFWIITAEYLKTHTYMVTPPPDALHPLHNVARVVTGLLPDWGRMGSEGLLEYFNLKTVLRSMRAQ